MNNKNGEGIQLPQSGNKGEIILYQPDSSIRLEVRIENETVWLNRQQIAVLFGRDVKTIGKHINNALNEELLGLPTVANFATLQKEGDRIVERKIEYYNLDMILSIGYRVKSQKGVNATIYTAQISHQLQLDLQKYNAQYPPVTVNIYTQSHDRFLFIDNDVYHIGASLKDLGKKLFAFSKMRLNTKMLLQNIT